MSAGPLHRSYWDYVLTNKPHGTLYIGVTNSLERRVWQHKTKAVDGFTMRYGLNRLVYFEEFRDVSNAIARETELKGCCAQKRSLSSKRKTRSGKTWPRRGINL